MAGPVGRSPDEEALLQKAMRVLPGGVLGGYYAPQELAFVVREARGPRLHDFSGREYIDYILGSGPLVLGHAHPAVVAAVEAQLRRGTTYFQLSEPTLNLAEEICRAVPCAEQVRFCGSGSEATFFALRVARAYRKRDKILKFEGGFHGVHDYSLMSVGPREPKAFPAPTPDSAGIPHAIQGEVLVAPFNDLAETEAMIEAHHHDLAAVIMEPFQRLIVPDGDFLRGVRAVTSRHGIPLIFDEIDTGIGGAVAETVGRSLKKLGRERQVLCVTHLPQVAAQGDDQWSVSRSGVKVKVTKLDRKSRIAELARMLGGAESTARKHAEELLDG